MKNRLLQMIVATGILLSVFSGCLVQHPSYATYPNETVRPERFRNLREERRYYRRHPELVNPRYDNSRRYDDRYRP
jgi:hypothetical protein